jgi:hypothetical protein
MTSQHTAEDYFSYHRYRGRHFTLLGSGNEDRRHGIFVRLHHLFGRCRMLSSLLIACKLPSHRAHLLVIHLVRYFTTLSALITLTNRLFIVFTGYPEPKPIRSFRLVAFH